MISFSTRKTGWKCKQSIQQSNDTQNRNHLHSSIGEESSWISCNRRKHRNLMKLQRISKFWKSFDRLRGKTEGTYRASATPSIISKSHYQPDFIKHCRTSSIHRSLTWLGSDLGVVMDVAVELRTVGMISEWPWKLRRTIQLDGNQMWVRQWKTRVGDLSFFNSFLSTGSLWKCDSNGISEISRES